MAIFDVFNGDADGICALVQMRNSDPKESTLITGVKRDIKLLEKVSAQAGDQVNALDISMDKNKAALETLLQNDVEVFYCDHHVAGDIPASEKLEALINTAPDICTSLLINGRLNGAFASWAVVGAFGDNLKKSAESLAAGIQLNEVEVKKLDNLGVYINYNGYGSSLEDLHFAPADLYQRVASYADPLTFIEEDAETFGQLEDGYHTDMKQAQGSQQLKADSVSAAFLLPNEKWARRVSGVFGNDLANQFPDRAHAVLTERADGAYLVSVRAPLNNKVKADKICMAFPTGGGRKAAAGINALPAEMLNQFLDTLNATYA